MGACARCWRGCRGAPVLGACDLPAATLELYGVRRVHRASSRRATANSLGTGRARSDAHAATASPGASRDAATNATVAAHRRHRDRRPPGVSRAGAGRHPGPRPRDPALQPRFTFRSVAQYTDACVVVERGCRGACRRCGTVCALPPPSGGSRWSTITNAVSCSSVPSAKPHEGVSPYTARPDLESRMSSWATASAMGIPVVFSIHNHCPFGLISRNTYFP